MSSARRLSAIMFTDMVGFTARTQSDEQGTLELLAEVERLIRPLLSEHHGRPVKSTGDGLLAEFPSALEATRCAVAIQAALRARNERPGNAPFELRIGIHLGDVEQRGDDIFGDAVNIAARVQPAADPGGVAISRQVYDQVHNKVDLEFHELGPQQLKGVRAPTELYRVELTGSTRRSVPDAEEEGPVRLAVLPFTNISPDPHDAYFSDGLTEEVISVLSQLRGLRVIARTSVEPYRASPKSVAQIGAELGVGRLLVGSVRKAGTRLRITLQLIAVRTQDHLWSQTYDRDLDDVFALQSEMAERVAEALRIQLLAGEKAHLSRRRPIDPNSYLEYLKGRTLMRGIVRADLTRALERLERAIELDPSNAAAHAGLADLHGILGTMYHHLPPDAWRRIGREKAERALELDPELAEAHTALALLALYEDDFAGAERRFLRAIELNPSYADAHHWYGSWLADWGDPEGALRQFALAEALDPWSALVLASQISLLIALRRIEEARKQLARLGEVEQKGLLFHDLSSSLALATGDLNGFEAELRHLDRILADRPEMVTATAFLAAARGERERALEMLPAVEQLPPEVRPDFGISRVYLALGDIDRSFRWLEIARENHRFAPRLVRYDPDYAAIRADPRYARLLATLKMA